MSTEGNTMGRVGYDPFGSDCAMDWVDEFSKNPTTQFIKEGLERQDNWNPVNFGSTYVPFSVPTDEGWCALRLVASMVTGHDEKNATTGAQYRAIYRAEPGERLSDLLDAALVTYARIAQIPLELPRMMNARPVDAPHISDPSWRRDRSYIKFLYKMMKHAMHDARVISKYRFKILTGEESDRLPYDSLRV